MMISKFSKIMRTSDGYTPDDENQPVKVLSIYVSRIVDLAHNFQ